jgi:hypothetical protein
MATYTPAQLYGNGSQGEDISTSLTFTFNNPSGSSYFTIETVQDRTGSFAGKQKTTSGSWVPSSGSMGPVRSDFFASVVVQPGVSSVTLTPATTITGSNYRMKGTGAFTVVTSGGAPPPPPVYSFLLRDCGDTVGTVYSLSSSFQPGIFIYNDTQLTSPFTGNRSYNTTDLGLMYFIDSNGLVLEASEICG